MVETYEASPFYTSMSIDILTNEDIAAKSMQ